MDGKRVVIYDLKNVDDIMDADPYLGGLAPDAEHFRSRLSKIKLK